MIYPKTIGQAILCDAMRHNEIVFATGVALVPVKHILR